MALFFLSAPLKRNLFSVLKYLQVNSRDKQSEMRSSRSLGDLKGSLLKGSERVRKHSTGELVIGAEKCNVKRFQNVVSQASSWCRQLKLPPSCLPGRPVKCSF